MNGGEIPHVKIGLRLIDGMVHLFAERVEVSANFAYRRWGQAAALACGLATRWLILGWRILAASVVAAIFVALHMSFKKGHCLLQLLAMTLPRRSAMPMTAVFFLPRPLLKRMGLRIRMSAGDDKD